MPTMRQLMESASIYEDFLGESITSSKIFQLVCELDYALEKVNFDQLPDDQRASWISAKKALGAIVEANPQ